MAKIGQVINKMIDYYSQDPQQVNHFLKVYGFAKTIAEMENIDGNTKEIIEIAALMHDIGIKNSLEKYKSSAGNYQEIEGPPEARKILEGMGYRAELIDRVDFLIANHHTYDNIEGVDYQILVEADFLVNVYENDLSKEEKKNIYTNIFKSSAGKKIFKDLYNM